MVVKKASTTRKAAAKKAPAKKAPAKKAAAKKAAVTRKKAAAKRSTAAKKAAVTRKKAAAKRSTAAKKAAATRKSTAKKSTAKRAPAKKKATAKRAPAKKVAAKRAPAKKTAAKKTAARKTTARKATAGRRRPSASSVPPPVDPADAGVAGIGDDAAVDALCDDLTAEHDDLARLVAGADLSVPTPAPGWSVADQLSHLWFFDQRALLALTDPDGFAADAEHLLRAVVEGPDPSIQAARTLPDDQLLDGWRTDRRRLVDEARMTDPKRRIPWYGPAMSARSFVTARLMETWAHGQDVADAVRVERRPTDRLRHVAHIGVAPAVQLRGQWTGPRRDTDPGRARRTVWRRVGLGPRRRAGPRTRTGDRLLPAGHAAAPP